MGGDRVLDLGRIDVLAAGLDQLLGRRTALVPEVALGIEGAVVSRVMPAVAEGEGGIGLAVPVALEDGGAAHGDLADLAGGDRVVGLIEYGDRIEEGGPSGSPGLVAERPHGDEARGLGLAEGRPEAGVRTLPLEAGDGLGAVEAGDDAQTGEIARAAFGLIEQRAQDRRELRQHRHLLAADLGERRIGVELRHHDGGATGVLGGQQHGEAGDVEQRQNAEIDRVRRQRPVVQELGATGQ